MDERRDEHRLARDLLGPYVLGALDPEEEWEVESHLRRCAGCRQEERDIRQAHEHMAGLAATTETLPPGLKQRILVRSQEQAPGRSSGLARRRRAPLAAVAALLVLLGLAAVYASGLLSREATTASLEPTGLAPSAGGELQVRSSAPNMRARLEVWDLPRPERDEYYELWFGKGKGRVSAGTFTVDDEGEGTLYMSVPETIGGYRRVGITRERFPEEPRMNSARVVLGGKLDEP